MALQSVPGTVASILGVVAIVIFSVIGIVLTLVIVTWMFMVPLVPCLEGQVPSSGPLRRAWDLLRGQWRRALGLMFLLFVCLTALSFIIQAAAGLVAVFSGGDMSWDSFTGISEGVSLVVYMALNTLSSLITWPFVFLLTAMFYLDLRIRKEALDLEWSAHVSSPLENQTGANQLNTAPQVESLGQWTAGAPQASVAAPTFDSPGSVGTMVPPLSANAFNGGPDSSLSHGSSTQPPQIIAGPAQTRPLPGTTNELPASERPQAITSTQQALADQLPRAEAAVSSGENPPQGPTATSAPPAAQNATAVCPQCNAAVRNDQTFCMQCGARLAASTSTLGSPIE
jgi:hypothetical protein